MFSKHGLPVNGFEALTWAVFLKSLLSLPSPQLKKLKDFNFEDWRQRYLRWMSHKKARVMDFFRKLDLDRDGKLTRKEFSDGIINSSKFLESHGGDLGSFCRNCLSP